MNADLKIISDGRQLSKISVSKATKKVQSIAQKNLKKNIDRAKTTLKKRIKRLENNNLQSSPAYHQYMDSNDVINFSVKGKTTQELQSEFWKLQHLLDMKTGTVKGANEVLVEIASNTGITFNNVNDLKEKSKLFFKLAETAKNLLESAGEAARALDYRKIWNDVSELMKEESVRIDNTIKDVTDLTEQAQVDLYNDLINKIRETIADDISNEL